MSDENKVKMNHSIILDNRKSLHLSGVTDVGAFDEQIIRTVTSMGGLVIRGKGMHISRLSLETGDLLIDGEIHAMQYTEMIHKGKGTLSRIFR